MVGTKAGWALAAVAVAGLVASGVAHAQTKGPAPNFAIAVTLSPAAAKRVGGLKEAITVAAYYYGEPTKAAAKKADEVGQIDLGSEEIRLGSAGGTATFTGKGFKADRLGWVVGREGRVNINVYTARLVHPDNLLDCGLFEDTLAVAQGRTIPMTCKLIGEK